jgi:hypothetical protein
MERLSGRRVRSAPRIRETLSLLEIAMDEKDQTAGTAAGFITVYESSDGGSGDPRKTFGSSLLTYKAVRRVRVKPERM